MDRRHFLRWSSLGLISSTLPGCREFYRASGWPVESESQRGPAFSVVPVVGDGRWIWTEPPKDETGYLEPRPYSLSVGIEMEASGDATEIRASTPVPVAYPEQTIDDLQIETEGCEAVVRELAPGFGQLFLSAGEVAGGEVIRAVAHYKLTLFKQYQGYQRDQFPPEQKPSIEIRKAYLQDSPGIQTTAPAVRALAKKLSAEVTHPCAGFRAARRRVDRAKISSQLIGPYTNVVTALESRHRAIAKKWPRRSSWPYAGRKAFRPDWFGCRITIGPSFI